MWDCADDVLLRAISPLPHAHDVLGIVSTCLPVATLSLCLACSLSLERITELCAWGRIKTSSGAAGPMPHAELVWAAVENNSTYKKKIKITYAHIQRFTLLSLLWTEIWEAGRNAWGLGHGWAQNRSQCRDRSVQPVLIPAHATTVFVTFRSLFLCVVKQGMQAKQNTAWGSLSCTFFKNTESILAVVCTALRFLYWKSKIPSLYCS